MPSSGGKASKWQPLSTADPDPVTDHDPFSLGDSDDEESKKKDTRVDDSVKPSTSTAEPAIIDLSPSGKGNVDQEEGKVENSAGGKT